ncbi:MAG: ABC transporter ATP-binding protein [Clostridia bacterium]|nr:ABC transporter ATP-binding protein [Clostridia bacterium]
MENKRREILKFENVSLRYHTKDGETLALKDVNFSVYEQEFVAIVGPSGCGKTTLLSLIAGILKPSEGKIYLDGKDISLYKNKALQGENASLGYMFQKDQLFEWRNIWKNVTLGVELKKKKKDTQLLSRVENLLNKYGLGSFKKSKPSELSGGMRQRVALIRTLALNPTLLLLDEPFSALDFQTRLNVCDNVSKIISNEKKTAILVTHDISEAVSLADRVIVLSSRPGTVKKIVEINLKEFGTPLERRESKKAHEYFDEIWNELVIHKNKGDSNEKNN